MTEGTLKYEVWILLECNLPGVYLVITVFDYCKNIACETVNLFGKLYKRKNIEKAQKIKRLPSLTNAGTTVKMNFYKQ